VAPGESPGLSHLQAEARNNLAKATPCATIESGAHNMLTRVKAKNFRLFKELDLELAAGLPTVLIGPNSSGKSSVLELIDIGSQLAEGRNLHQIFNEQRGGLPEVRSRLQEGELSIAFEFVNDTHVVSYEASFVGQSGGNVVFSEESIKEGSLVSGSTKKTGWAHSSYGAARPGYNDARLLISPDREELYRTELALAKARSRRKGKVDPEKVDGAATLEKATRKQLDQKIAALQALRKELLTMRYHGSCPVYPKWLTTGYSEGPRTSTVIGPADYLDRTGKNLVNYLYNRSINDPANWKQIVRRFTDEFRYVTDLLFPPDASGGRIALGWRDRRGGDGLMYAFQMSEGMIQFLTVLASLLVPNKSTSVVALDEPDVYLHPSAVLSLISTANAVAAHTPVLIATHSDKILDGLADPAASIRICTTDDEGAHIAVPDKETLRAWLKEYDPSDLRRKGMLDPLNAEDASRKGE
jgi:predicted ATPase